MKRNLNAGLTFFLTLSLAACSGSNNTPQRRNQTPTGAPGTVVTGSNGLVMVGNVQCNTASQNPQDPASPLNPQSPCNSLAVNGQLNPNGTQQIAPTYPTNGGVNGQFNGQNGVNGINGQQGQNFQNPALYQVNAPQSDINPNTGRIVNKTFHLARGSAAQEAVNDTCYPDKHYSDSLFETSSVKDSRFYHSTYGDRFDLNFDSQGNLTITAQSLIGRVSSGGAVPYVLDDNTQTVTIGALPDGTVRGFQMIGPASPAYQQHETYIEHVVENLRNGKTKTALDISESIPSDFSGGGGASGQGSGFVLNHGGPTTGLNSSAPAGLSPIPGLSNGAVNNGAAVNPNLPPAAQQALAQNGRVIPAIQPINGSLQGQGRPLNASYAQQSPQVSSSELPNNIVMLEFPEGLTAHVVTMPMQPQHINFMYAGTDARGNVEGEGVTFHSSATITNRSLVHPCNADGHGGMVLFFSPQ